MMVLLSGGILISIPEVITTLIENTIPAVIACSN
jgi:hypothetical protein